MANNWFPVPEAWQLESFADFLVEQDFALVSAGPENEQAPQVAQTASASPSVWFGTTETTPVDFLPPPPPRPPSAPPTSQYPLWVSAFPPLPPPAPAPAPAVLFPAPAPATVLAPAPAPAPPLPPLQQPRQPQQQQQQQPPVGNGVKRYRHPAGYRYTRADRCHECRRCGAWYDKPASVERHCQKQHRAWFDAEVAAGRLVYEDRGMRRYIR